MRLRIPIVTCPPNKANLKDIDLIKIAASVLEEFNKVSLYSESDTSIILETYLLITGYKNIYMLHQIRALLKPIES